MICRKLTERIHVPRHKHTRTARVRTSPTPPPHTRAPCTASAHSLPSCFYRAFADKKDRSKRVY
jgi:hypothetical protein